MTSNSSPGSSEILLDVVVLAAGHGKRMHSKLPKVLHKLAGKPLLQYLIETVSRLSPHAIYVVYGNGGGQVPHCLERLPVTWVRQSELLGTGHAVAQVIPKIGNNNRQVLILLGDTPLISIGTLKKLIHHTRTDEVGLITIITPQPFGLGRVVRNEQGEITKIIEEREASLKQKKIQEVNSGIFCVPVGLLRRWLPRLKKMNVQGEYYLTDIIEMAAAAKVKIVTVSPEIEGELQGVNDRVQLARLERYYQLQQAETLMLRGVTLCDPARFDLRGCLSAGKDVVIDINVVLEGDNTIGADCFIGPHTTLKNVKIGTGVEIKGYSVIEDAVIGNYCIIGPFARIRPGTRLKDRVHVGNFVEIKNSQIQSASKINHLSYVGDATLGKDVNIGAGTITCNYDGVTKHETIIEDNVFVGANTALIAPIRVGKRATIGAGSVLSKDVPPGKLTLSRARACTIAIWKRPIKRDP